MAATVADLLIDRLISWGVDTIFGFPGDGVNGIFEALRTHQKRIRFIQVRHEEAAAFAAVGYAKYTGRLGVCLATSGPGGVHLLNGLYDAKCDLQPVLAITGHTFHDLIGTHFQQDVDLDKLFIDVSVYNQRVMGPAHVCNVVDEAIRTALARRGVAHITIPKDIQDMKQSDDQRSGMNVPGHSADIYARAYSVPPESQLRRAADIINNGKRVAILVGRGCLGAGDEVLELAEKIGAPIIKALLGKAVVPDASDYTTGGVGLLGTAPSQDALEECDTLLIAGSSFPYIDFYPKPGRAKCVQIDIDPARIGLRYPADVGLAGDCKAVLDALLPFIDRKKSKDFLKTAQNRMKSWRKLMHERGTRDDMPLKPQVVAYQLNRFIDDDAIFSTDSGSITTWAARYVDIRKKMQFSLSGTLATMANGLPYSIGAAIAYPKRQVVCMVGDGGLAMLMAELATLAKYDLNVKVFVMRNNVLAQIKWEQIVMEGAPEFGVDLPHIDFSMIARACGIASFRLENPKDAETIVRQALHRRGPALVESLVDPNEPPLPGNINTSQALHFAEALIRGEKNALGILKTIAKDRVKEVV
jgi:pyruvate dehydrogenase (quinone)